MWLAKRSKTRLIKLGNQSFTPIRNLTITFKVIINVSLNEIGAFYATSPLYHGVIGAGFWF